MAVKHIVIDARGRESSTGRYVDRLLESLQKLDTNNRYTVLLKPTDKWAAKSKNFSATYCKYKAFSFNPIQQITFSLYLYKLKPDLVHFWMTPQEPIFYFGKRVTTTHDLTMLRFARAGKLPAVLHTIRMVGYRFLMWYSHRLDKQIIAPTNFAKQDIISLHPFVKNKISVTLEAAEPALAEAAVEPKTVVKNVKFLFAVGTAFPHKNLENLILAHKILLQKYPDLHLYLAGKKEYYYQKLDAFIEQNTNTERVHTMGYISDAELKWMYEQANVYVFPSFSEGFGLPALEAMTHGVPVASSNATCLPEVCGSAAHYFDPHSPADMAQKIEDLLTDKKIRLRLIDEGYLQVKKFSWRRMAEETLDIYKKVLSD